MKSKWIVFGLLFLNSLNASAQDIIIDSRGEKFGDIRFISSNSNSISFVITTDVTVGMLELFPADVDKFISTGFYQFFKRQTDVQRGRFNANEYYVGEDLFLDFVGVVVLSDKLKKNELLIHFILGDREPQSFRFEYVLLTNMKK